MKLGGRQRIILFICSVVRDESFVAISDKRVRLRSRRKSLFWINARAEAKSSNVCIGGEHWHDISP